MENKCSTCIHRGICKYEEWFKEFEKKIDDFVLNYDGSGGPPGYFIRYKLECARFKSKNEGSVAFK